MSIPDQSSTGVPVASINLAGSDGRPANVGQFDPATMARLANSGVVPSTTAQISANTTITALNASTYDGQTLEFTGAFTLTISAGLNNNFGCAIIPPASGNASIASDGTATLNGATTTLTRAAAGNAMVAITQRASNRNAYVVTGS